jgi:exoribonuclease R
MDVRIPKIRIRTRAWQKFLNVRLKVEIDGWDAGSKYPSGHCVDILGPVGDLEAEISALLLENQVLLDPFSVAAKSCLPAIGEKWQVSEADVQQRKDLRESRRVFSVDPPGCQDIDDTMHAEVLPNGDIEG